MLLTTELYLAKAILNRGADQITLYACSPPAFVNTHPISGSVVHFLARNPPPLTHTLFAHFPPQDQCFYQLRTVEQLGYVVFCFQPTYSGITSFQALVQSQEYNTSYVLGKINTFLENFEISTIANFTDDTLSANKELYARTLRKKSQTLRDESDRLWGEISTGREQFDYNDQLLGALSSITPQSLLGFYRQHMTDPTQFRKLVIGVHGVDKPVDLSQETSYCIDWETIDQNVLEYNATNSNCSRTKLTL